MGAVCFVSRFRRRRLTHSQLAVARSAVTHIRRASPFQAGHQRQGDCDPADAEHRPEGNSESVDVRMQFT